MPAMTPEDEQRMRAAVMRMLQEKQGGGMPSGMTPGMATPNAAPASLEDKFYVAPKQDRSAARGKLKRQGDFAQSLRGQRAPQGRNVGPLNVYMGPNIGESVAYAGSQLMGGYLSGKADKASDELGELEVADAEATARGLAKATAAVEATRLSERGEDISRETRGDRESGEWDVGGKAVRGYTEEGVAYREDGTAMPGDATLMPKITRGSGSRYTLFKAKDEYGNEVWKSHDKQTNVTTPTEFVTGEAWTAKGAADRADTTTDVTAGRAGDVTTEQESAKSNQTTIDSLDESIASTRKTIGNYKDAVQALADGARSGFIEGKLPSIREASVRLENAQQKAGLSELSQHTFGSLSEKEGEWVRSSSIPLNMDEKYLPDFLERKIQAAEVAQEAMEFERGYREKFGKRPSKEMMQKILYKHGEIFNTPREWLKEE